MNFCPRNSLTKIIPSSQRTNIVSHETPAIITVFSQASIYSRMYPEGTMCSAVTPTSQNPPISIRHPETWRLVSFNSSTFRYSCQAAEKDLNRMSRNGQSLCFRCDLGKHS